jgi:hypothetical protein
VVNGLDLNHHVQSSNGFGLASSNLVIVAVSMGVNHILFGPRGSSGRDEGRVLGGRFDHFGRMSAFAAFFWALH